MDGIWTNFSPGKCDFAGGVLELDTVSKALLEDLEITIRRIDIQKEDKTCESDGDSRGAITPQALGLQQVSSLSTFSSSLPAGGDYFSLSQEHHHRQGLYQTLTVYQPQDISPNDNVFTLKPLLPQMRSRSVGRPTPNDPSRQNPSPTTNVAGGVGVAAETSPQLRAIKRPNPEIRPTPAGTVTLAPRSQQSIREAMPPPPHPTAPNSADNTRQSHHVREKHFSSLSSMLSTEPTAPGPSAVSRGPVENIIGLHTMQIPKPQTQDQTQDHGHSWSAQVPDAEYPQQTDLSSIKQARLLGCPQYWAQRAREQWEQDMEIMGVERAKFEAERREGEIEGSPGWG